MNIPSEDKHYDEGSTRFLTKNYFYQSIKGKKIIQVDLDEEYALEESYLFEAKRNFISREIETLQFTGDTSSVLKIKLGEKNTYGQFVWILNQALIYKLRRYAFVDDSYFLMANPPAADESRHVNTFIDL